MADFTSKLVQITPYCLMEYRYTSPISPETQDYDFYKIVNGHTGYVHLMNIDSADDTTRNVRERSAVQISGGTWVDTDKDQSPNYLTYDADLTVTTESGASLPYDTVLFHFLAGYNFEDLDGVMLHINAPERSGKNLVLANLVFLKTSDYFDYNPQPILLGGKLYDRYVSVKIPAPKINNDEYYSLEGSPSQASTFIARVTSNGMGLLRSDPMHVSVIEIKSTTEVSVGAATYNHYKIGTTSTVALNQADQFALLGATIQPSEGGDYFEYFGTWSGGFIEDYIGATNGLPGYDYVVIHELRVLEQIGSLFTQTSYFQSIQEDGFDEPNLFRPIVHNGGTAASFTIEYTFRLYNKADSSQIIRLSSYTSYEPSVWGKDLTKIELLNGPESNKIYNKVVAGPTMPTVAFINNAIAPTVTPTGAKTIQTVTKFVPSFFDRMMVSVHQDTLYLDANGQLQTQNDATTQPIYGQGDSTIVVTPFDNYYKFKILKTEATAGNTPIPLDLGQNSKFYIVFMNNNNEKVRFVYMIDEKIGDPQAGDILFKIPAADSTAILGYNNRQFWITSRLDETGDETGIYFGEFVTADEMDTLRDRQAAAESRSTQLADLQARISELEAALAAAQAAALAQTNTSSTTTLAPTNTSANTSNPVTEDGVKIPSKIKKETEFQIKNKVVGVGETIPTDKSSVVSNLVPKGNVKKTTDKKK